MLTKFFENGRTKAHMYWPACNNIPMTYGDIQVTKMDEEEDFGGSLVIRTFLLSRGSEARTVYHLHYTAWPDFGVPCSTEGVRELVSLVNEYRDQHSAFPNGPLVVHCSAGVGRSGTFIAIHYACGLLDNGMEPSIFQIAAQMRRDRIGMVQNDKQFEFIHTSVRDYRASFDCEYDDEDLDVFHSEINISVSSDDSSNSCLSVEAFRFLQSASSTPSSSSSSSPDSYSPAISMTSSTNSSGTNSESNSFPTSPTASDWRKISSVGVNIHSLRFSNQAPLALNVHS
jgi:hypothetical protein